MSIDEWALTRSLAALTAYMAAPAVTLSDQLGVLVSAAAELLGVDSVGILLLDDFDHVRTVAVSGPAAAALEQAQEQLQLGPGIDVFAARRVVAVVDLATDPDYERLWSELVDTGVRGVLSAPVIVRNEIVGNLNAITGQRHEWSQAERRAGAALGGLIGQLLRTATSSAPDVDALRDIASERETGEPGT